MTKSDWLINFLYIDKKHRQDCFSDSPYWLKTGLGAWGSEPLTLVCRGKDLSRTVLGEILQSRPSFSMCAASSTRAGEGGGAARWDSVPMESSRLSLSPSDR